MVISYESSKNCKSLMSFAKPQSLLLMVEKLLFDGAILEQSYTLPELREEIITRWGEPSTFQELRDCIDRINKKYVNDFRCGVQMIINVNGEERNNKLVWRWRNANKAHKR